MWPRLIHHGLTFQKNHTENIHQEITRMNINVSIIRTSVNDLICLSIEDIQVAM